MASDPPVLPVSMSRVRSAHEIVQECSTSLLWQQRFKGDLAQAGGSRPLVYLAQITMNGAQVESDLTSVSEEERAALYAKVPGLQARIEDRTRTDPIILAARIQYSDQNIVTLVTDFGA